MTVRFDIVAYKNIGDKYPSVHLGIPSNRVKRLTKSLKELGYTQIVTTEVEHTDETVRLATGLGITTR